MKRYSELSVEELAAASDETLSVLIDLEYAHNGVIPAEPPKYAPLPAVDIKPTQEMYDVDGTIFKNIIDAEVFKKMERYKADYDYSLSTEYKYLSPANEYYGIKPEKYYKKSDIDSIRIVLLDIKRIEKDNKVLREAYEKFCKETTDIRNEVYDAYQEACTIVSRRDHAAKVYEKHMVLAEGNKDIADKFFRDAYKNEPDIVAHILPESR